MALKAFGRGAGEGGVQGGYDKIFALASGIYIVGLHIFPTNSKSKSPNRSTYRLRITYVIERDGERTTLLSGSRPQWCEPNPIPLIMLPSFETLTTGADTALCGAAPIHPSVRQSTTLE